MLKLGNIRISWESIGSIVLLAYLVIYLNPDWYNMNFWINNGPIMACLVLYLLSKLQKGVKIRKYEIFIFAYILISFFSYLCSTSPEFSNPYIRDVVMNSIALLYLYEYARGSQKNAVKLMNYYIFSATVVCIYICVTAGVVNIILFGMGKKTVGDAWNANDIACRLALALSFVGYMLCNQKELFAKRKAYYLFAAVIISFCVIFSGSRTGLILLAGIIAVILFVMNRKHLLFAFLISAISIFAVYQLVMNVETLYNIIGYRIRNLVLFANDQQADENSVYIRQQLIEQGFEWFKQKPIFGYGIGIFSYLHSTGEYAHNGYIELLVGMGLVGTITFFMPMFSVLSTSIRNRISPSSMYVSLIVILLFVAAYSSVISYSAFYSIVICIYFVLEEHKKAEGAIYDYKSE